jgi:hypothetical protein
MTRVSFRRVIRCAPGRDDAEATRVQSGAGPHTTSERTDHDQHHCHQYDQQHASRLLLPTAIGSTAVAAALSYVGSHDMGEWFFEIGVQVVGAAVIFGLVVPRGLRHESAGWRAIVMGGLGLLLVVPAFWLGLPVQLGAAAVLLGYAGHRAPSGSGKALTALVIGAITVLAYLVIHLGDYLDTH